MLSLFTPHESLGPRVAHRSVAGEACPDASTRTLSAVGRSRGVVSTRKRLGRLMRAPALAISILCAVLVCVGLWMSFGGAAQKPSLLDAGANGEEKTSLAVPATSDGGEARSGEHTATSAASKRVFVHVVGEVKQPGLVELPEGARVSEALEAAGGASNNANLAGVNLARILIDGEQVVVPNSSEPGSTQSAGAASQSSTTPMNPGGESKVSLNSASAAELETLDGVGPALAERIISWREAHGGFQTVDDLTSVSGIGDKKFAAIKDQVTL